MRIRIARGFFTSAFGLALLGGALAVLLAVTGVFTYYYVQFGHEINQRLTGQIYQNTSRVYSAPGRIFVGEMMRPAELTSYLLGAGYQEGVCSGLSGTISFWRSPR